MATMTLWCVHYRAPSLESGGFFRYFATEEEAKACAEAEKKHAEFEVKVNAEEIPLDAPALAAWINEEFYSGY